MVDTACTVNDISLTTVVNGGRYQGGIDKDGMELPDVQLIADFLPDKREYYCHNCRKTWDGSDTFDEVKRHFGTFPVD